MVKLTKSPPGPGLTGHQTQPTNAAPTATAIGATQPLTTQLYTPLPKTTYTPTQHLPPLRTLSQPLKSTRFRRFRLRHRHRVSLRWLLRSNGQFPGALSMKQWAIVIGTVKVGEAGDLVLKQGDVDQILKRSVTTKVRGNLQRIRPAYSRRTTPRLEMMAFSFAASDGSEMNELFLSTYEPQEFDLDAELKPFIPDYITSMGILMPLRPDEKPDSLDLTVLDEPAAAQPDPSVLDLHPRAFSEFTAVAAQTVWPIDAITMRTNPQVIDAWIQNIRELHGSKPSPSVHHTRRMPDVEHLMQPPIPQSKVSSNPTIGHTQPTIPVTTLAFEGPEDSDPLPTFEETDEEHIDLAHPKIQEPILCYEELDQFQDELGDNGTAIMKTRM
ncbi:Intraflagellar transport protein 46, partial [Rhizophlyctis rosea]